MAKVANKLNLEQILREMVQDVIFEELVKEFKPGLAVHPDDYIEPEDREGEEDFWAHRHEMMPRDPELDMNPIDKELMMNSLLDLEFQEEPTKTIPIPVVREMIRESVKKTLGKK